MYLYVASLFEFHVHWLHVRWLHVRQAECNPFAMYMYMWAATCVLTRHHLRVPLATIPLQALLHSIFA
jgi:hypothetical protein